MQLFHGALVRYGWLRTPGGVHIADPKLQMNEMGGVKLT